MSNKVPKDKEPPNDLNEAIGRPQEWREGRYQKDGTPPESSVLKKPKEGIARPAIPSSPVTREDYE